MGGGRTLPSRLGEKLSLVVMNTVFECGAMRRFLKQKEYR
jgi:hypothetical protein